jgi:hypothetical protein
VKEQGTGLTTQATPTADEAAAQRQRAKRRAQARAAFLRQMLQWHWISAAICLIGMLLFSITGVTLNHADIIPATPKVVHLDGQMPADPLTALRKAEAGKAPLPDPARAWLGKSMKIRAPARAPIEWSDGEAYVALARPGGDAWVTIETETGAVAYERTDRGWVSYLNDLHKGRNTGVVWKWFLDIFAIGAVVFCATGLLLLWLHSHARKSTWPLVGLGLIAPLILILIFIH